MTQHMTHHKTSNIPSLSAAVWLPLIALTTGPLAAGDVQRETTQPGEHATLVERVEAYFKSADPKRRRALIGEIDAAADRSVDAVAQALQQVQLWQAPEDNGGTFPFVSASGETIEVAYLLPPDYDPARRYPSVICMPGRGWPQKDSLHFTGMLAGKSTDDAFIILCPSRPIDAAFSREASQSDEFRHFLREVRRQFHTDTDRTFLWGQDTGGDAAWMAAVAHPHEFAGAIFVSSYLPVPYPNQVYPLLLGNLRSLPLLTIWRECDESTGPVRERSVAAHNRAIMAVAKREKLPLAAKAAPPNLPLDLSAFAGNEVDTILAQRRPTSPHRVSHWFRYPDQGDTGWLRLTKFKGDVWEQEQLAILASPTTDRDAYITKIIKGRLAYIGATVQGQTIDIETRKCRRVDILFPSGLVDLDKPVTIRCNGKRRHNGPIRPTIRTLLETTYDTWDFQRLTPARLSISIKSDRRTSGGGS